MLDGHPPARIAKSTASQLTADDERENRAASAPKGDFPAEPPTAFPKKPAIAAESTRSEGEVDKHDSGQPDGNGRGAGSRGGNPTLQADVPRGYTVARTAEELIVSENTIRTHSKRIYAKLDVHKKQELIDMLKAVEL